VETFPFYLTLGMSRRARKLGLRERMLRKAESNSKKGLNTRIPFLKKALCGQDVRIPRETKNDIPDMKEGEVLIVKCGLRPLFTISSESEMAARFNMANVGSGLQALPAKPEKGEMGRYVVGRCKNELIGDLIISEVPIERLTPMTLRGTAAYFYDINQIVKSETASESTLAHELEHATHLGLWHLAGFPRILIRSSEAEYFSLLVELRDFATVELAYLGTWDIPHLREGQSPHMEASRRFRKALERLHGMKPYEIDLGVCAAFAPGLGNEPSPEDVGLLKKIREFAGTEYKSAYEKLFGLSLEDIRGIVASL
jgi:hypothetical protein